MSQVLRLLHIVGKTHYLLYILISMTSCNSYEEVKLSIDQPPRGQMIPSGVPVEIRITDKEESLGNILVDGIANEGMKLNDGKSLSVYRQPSYGLGFVYAERPNDPYLVVRSWLQGDFIPSNSWYPNSMILKFGYTGLNVGDDSLAGIISSSLVNVELSQFVEPIVVDLGITQASILIDSAVIKNMSLTLSISDDQMIVDIVLTPLEIDYRIENELLNSQGFATYEQIYINALAELDKSGVNLIQPSVMSGRLQINDEQLPDRLINAIAEALTDRFESTMSQVIAEVTYQVTAQLFEQFTPTLGISFQQEINQESRVSSVIVEENSLVISFETRMSAQNSQMTPNYGGALIGPLIDSKEYQEKMKFLVGSGLIHQLLYAAWDAGNFSNLSYTKAELESLGLGELNFPYSNLDKVTLDLLLPPTMEWTTEGPILVLGGVTADIKVDYSKDTRAWTAARVPIKLSFDQGSLRVSSDPLRMLKSEPVMLNRLNEIAERTEVLKLINTALPSVINDILSQFPLISIAPLELQALSNSPKLIVFPRLEAATTKYKHWELGLNLNVLND